MEKQKRKNDEAPSPLAPILRHSIWFFLLFSHLIWFCTWLTCHDAWDYMPYWRSLWCNYNVGLCFEVLITSVICLLIWYRVEDWVIRFERQIVIRALVILYLFPGRWLLTWIFTNILVVPEYRA